MKLLHVCEVCGKTEVLAPEEAFDAGWDYPPKMGSFGILSPRTCGGCTIDKTLWWKLSQDNVNLKDLSAKDKKTLERIVGEPQTILVEE